MQSDPPTAPLKSSATAVFLPQSRFSVMTRLCPILFFIGYLNFTVLLFIAGPWQWPVQDGTKLYIFLAFAHIALLGGYLSAAFDPPRGYSQRFPFYKVATWTMLINVALLLPTAAFRTGSFLPDVGEALRDPGTVYTETMALRDSSTPVVEYIRMLVGPFTALLLPVAVFYWRHLRWSIRILAVIAIFGTILLFIAMGTNKAIADTALMFPFLVVASHMSGVGRLSLKKLAIGAATALLFFSLFLGFFTSTMMTRSGSIAFAGYFPALGLHADLNNFMIKDAPPLVQVGAVGLDSYVTQGYYALYLSLEEPFVPMFGIGNSIFLTHQAVRLTDHQDIWKLSYPARIERSGWDAMALWSSIYPWIASDFSFPGTILVVFLIGRLFALSWLDTLDGTNPFAVAVFAQFVIMIFYFPANNQLLQFGEGLTGFLGTLILWGITRRPYHRFAALAPVLG